MKLCLRKKLVIALLAISLTSCAVTGLLGFWRSRSALIEAAFDRMTTLRVAKQGEVLRYFDHVRDHVRFVTRNPATIEATDDFVKAFEGLRTLPENQAEAAEIRQYYERTFMPALNEHFETGVKIDSILPDTAAARYLQSRYIVRNPNSLYEKSKHIDAGDATEYSAVHKKRHPVFRNMANELDYYDFMIVHPETHEIVYSVEKEIDLGTSLRSGPFSKSKLAQAIDSIDASTDPDKVIFVDFEFYVPSYSHPAMFIVSPIRDGQRFAGILVLQFSPERINKIMTGGKEEIETAGLGKTGEVLLVGKDNLMRSDSRFFLENADAYAEALVAAGYDRSVVDRMKTLGTTIMTIPRNPATIQRIFEKGADTAITVNQLKRKSLASFAPIRIEGLDWGIVAHLDEYEALASVREFLREALMLLLGILGLTGAVALLVGGAISRPIMRLTQAVRAFVNGFRDVRVKIDSGDEVEELANAFNDMASEIGTQETRLRRQVAENRKLLENFLPATVLARLRGKSDDDEQTPYRTETTLAFVEIEGLGQLFEDFDADIAMKMTRQLIETFDDAAHKHGVEKLTSSGAGYLAACGISKSHFDHTQRILAFVKELECLVTTFNAQHVTSLHLSAGVHRGRVGSGRIGRNDFVNELWAKTVELATEIEPTFGRSAIRVSDDVYERVSSNPDYRFERDSSTIETAAWTLLTNHHVR